MIQRGKKKASNKFYKLDRPMITSGEKAGQRDSERIVAKIQVIPDGAVNEYGEKKLTGFTLDEIRNVIETGETVVCRDFEENITANITVGSGMGQWTLTELKEIVAMVEGEGGPRLTDSPLDRFDRERLALERQTAPPTPPKPRGRPKKSATVTESEEAD